MISTFLFETLKARILEKALRRAWILIACVALPLFLASMLKGTPGKIITSDGNAYYAWLTTIVADQDLEFRNDFMKLYAPDPVDWIENSVGPVRNVTPPGMAVVMAPGFFVAHAWAKLSNTFRSTPLTPYDPLYKNITALGLLVFFLLGVA